MAYKDIVVHVGEDAHSNERLKVAIALAQRHNAHLTGVYVLSYPVVPGFVQAEVPTEVIEQRYQEIREQAEKRRGEFDATAQKEGASAEFRVMEGDAVDAVAMCARYADLVVVGQPDPDNPATDDRVAEGLILAAGRPLLMVPYVGDHSHIGQRVLVAWNGTREGSRAIHDAMPFLTAAEEVVVFGVNPPNDHIAGADMCTHLARHGVNATPKHVVAPDLSAGDAILSAIADNNIDLLVMGGYGHSRLREMALGGATRQVLQSMTCAVVMSH
jgi:nucleotide-binding universal stress UspA family protein